jgi:hypothetical protein
MPILLRGSTRLDEDVRSIVRLQIVPRVRMEYTFRVGNAPIGTKV